MFFIFICPKCRRVKFLARPPQSKLGQCRGCTVQRGPVTHGDAGFGIRRTKLYNTWLSMKERCYGVNALSWKDYGGRGISVCDVWRYSFQEFKDWALSNGYDQKLQIDRINNNGNYEPSSCRWVTAARNAQNRRNTVINYAIAAEIKGLLLIGYSPLPISILLGIKKYIVANVSRGKTWRDVQPKLESSLYV